LEQKSGKKIAFFLAHLKGGGAERVMVTLANKIAERGYNIDLVLASKEGELVSSVSEKVNLIDLGGRRILTTLPFLLSYIKKNKPDVLLSTLDYVNVIAILAVKLAGNKTKVYIRIANTISLTFRQKNFNVKLARISVPLVYRFADGIIAVSKGVEDDLIKTIPSVDKHTLSVIYNPVLRPEIYAKAAKAPDHEWLRNKDIPVVLGTGRLWKQKDFPVLIHSIKHLHEQKYPVRLIILGEGPERMNLEKLVKKLDLEDYVSLPGFNENPYAYMHEADVFVLSSRFEGLPNALIEAMACNCKVVSTNCPSGPYEILKGGEFGALVPVGDSFALAQAISLTLRRKDVKYDEGWLNQFTEEQIVSQYLKKLVEMNDE
jgi:glycosyltransferase involved in cell wall biosynthesis